MLLGILIGAFIVTLLAVAIWDYRRTNPRKIPPPPPVQYIDLPVPGESWSLVVTDIDYGSPWYKPNPRKITVWILDVKAGWVRYHFGEKKEPRSTTFPYDKPIDEFVSMFKRDPKEPA